MRCSLGRLPGIWAVVMSLALPAWAAQTVPSALDVGTGERLLLIAPHPDDETLGAGGLVQRVHTRGGSVRIVLVTAGDGFVEAVVHETGSLRPRPTAYIHYGERRLRETRAAVRQLAPDGIRLQFLGFPDGGIEKLLYAHWWRRHPERSPTTWASVPPYNEALEPDVPYDGSDLRRELENILRDVQPTIVVFPDPHDVHPDHRATGLFTMLALTDWRGKDVRAPSAAPRLLAYLIHWPDWPPGWQGMAPQTQTDHVPLVLPARLEREGPQLVLTLTDQEVANKRAALAKHVTQQEEMAALLAAFVRRTEPFTLIDAVQLEHVTSLVERRINRSVHGR
jgi:LmbE family N-acetylglucosaminyl deacetylase